MRGSLARPIAAAVVLTAGLAALIAGCDRLGLGGQPRESTDRPSARQLERIRYMSQAVGPDGRKYFDHLGQARSCRDLELAMRWNRPPDVPGGPFNKKMIYLTSTVPGDLPKQSEVFLLGRIERGAALPSGASGWSIRMKDGSEVQAIEPAEYWQQQEQRQQEGGAGAIVKPYIPGRTFCGRGIYQGKIGRSLKQGESVPLVSVLFAMDRGSGRRR